jgi:hypothetical protein
MLWHPIIVKKIANHCKCVKIGIKHPYIKADAYCSTSRQCWQDILFDNISGMCVFTDDLRDGKSTFESHCNTRHRIHELLHIDSKIHPFAMRSTRFVKTLLLKVTFLVLCWWESLIYISSPIVLPNQ